MLAAVAVRFDTSPKGTFADLYIEGGLRLAMGGLPWRNNENLFSCIPCGLYTLRPWDSGQFGWCLRFESVPGRTDVLIHWGNWCGDRRLGYRSSSKGCEVVGLRHGDIDGQRGVADSRKAIKALRDHIGPAGGLQLHIVSACAEQFAL